MKSASLRLLLGSVFNILFLLVFKAKHNLRVTCSNVYKVFKQLQSQPQPQHTVLGSRILRGLSIDVLVVLPFIKKMSTYFKSLGYLNASNYSNGKGMQPWLVSKRQLEI
jgi:hypothetical protein